MSETQVRTGSLLQRGRESLEQGVRLAFTELPQICQNLNEQSPTEKKLVCRSVRYWQLQFKKAGLPWSDDIVDEVLSEGLVETYRTMLQAQRFLDMLETNDALSVVKQLSKKASEELTNSELEAFVSVGRLLSELSNYMQRMTKPDSQQQYFVLEFPTYTMLPLWLNAQFQESARNLMRLKQLVSSNVEGLRHDFPHKLTLEIRHRRAHLDTDPEGVDSGPWIYQLSLDQEYKEIAAGLMSRFVQKADTKQPLTEDMVTDLLKQYVTMRNDAIGYGDVLGLCFSTFLQGLPVKLTQQKFETAANPPGLQSVQSWVFRPQRELVTSLQDSWWEWLFG